MGLRSIACWDCGLCSRQGHECLSVLSAECCHVEISASGWSLVQRSPADCGVSECDVEGSKMRGPSLLGPFAPWGKIYLFTWEIYCHVEILFHRNPRYGWSESCVRGTELVAEATLSVTWTAFIVRRKPNCYRCISVSACVVGTIA